MRHEKHDHTENRHVSSKVNKTPCQEIKSSSERCCHLLVGPGRPAVQPSSCCEPIGREANRNDPNPDHISISTGFFLLNSNFYPERVGFLFPRESKSFFLFEGKCIRNRSAGELMGFSSRLNRTRTEPSCRIRPISFL